MVAPKNAFAAKTVKFYRLGPVLSRNATINIILGPRGDGKTFAAKEQAIRNAINKNEQFIYLRRFKTELTSRHTFFDDIRFLWPDFKFVVKGSEAKMQRPGSKAWETIGYFVALTSSQQKKSVPYPQVTLIIFDEFLIDKGAMHYLPKEERIFLDFLSTVDRYQDKTRALLISNTVSIANPYFYAWGIRPPKDSEWFSDPSGFVVVHFIRDHEFAQEVRKTKLGAFIADTEYGAYAIEGEFHDNSDALIRQKPPTAYYRATIETPTGTFSWWVDSLPGIFYIQTKRPKQEVILTTMPESVTEGKIHLPYSNKLMQMLRTSYSHGRMYFDSPQARNAFLGAMF